jgi:hypothetical protein
MDQQRTIRLLYSPLFLAASLLLGYSLKPGHSFDWLMAMISGGSSTSSIGPVQALAILAGSGALLFAAGLLIGTITIVALRAIFWCWGKRRYEAVISDETAAQMREQLGSPSPAGTDLRADALYLEASFDHEKMNANTRDWTLRRWHGFNVCAHSCTALLLAMIVGLWPLRLPPSAGWLLATGIAFLVFLVNAICSWRETMEMAAFQSRRNRPALATAPASVDAKTA